MGNLLGAKDVLTDQGRSTREVDAALDVSFAAVYAARRALLDVWPVQGRRAHRGHPWERGNP